MLSPGGRGHSRAGRHHDRSRDDIAGDDTTGDDDSAGYDHASGGSGFSRYDDTGHDAWLADGRDDHVAGHVDGGSERRDDEPAAAVTLPTFPFIGPGSAAARK